MINRLMPRKRQSWRETLHRADRFAADLNVLLVVIAIGLATLDFTMLVTQKAVESLPPITRLNYDQPQADSR